MESGCVVRLEQSLVFRSSKIRYKKSRKNYTATTTQITVDNSSDTDLSDQNNPELVILPNGTVETKNVTSISGKVITLESALSQTPNVNSIWILKMILFLLSHLE